MNNITNQNELTPAFEIINAQGKSPLLIACDHAANLIPPSLLNLGLDAQYWQQHIAYDIGARQVALRLSEFFDAPLLLAKYSRLLIDLNRHLDDPSLIPEISDGIVIPANNNLSAEQRKHRINHYFQPYHQQYQRLATAQIAQHSRPIILALHSFTPMMNGVARPWEVGVLWNQDAVLAKQLMKNLAEVSDFNIGDNQPYHAAKPLGYAQSIYSKARGIELVMLEIRQDLIANDSQQNNIAQLIGKAIANILNQPLNQPSPA